MNIKSLMHICSLYYVVCDKLLDSLIPKKFKTQFHLTATKDNFSQVSRIETFSTTVIHSHREEDDDKP